MSVTDDGERVYVAGTTAGFYVLDSEAIAHHTRRELAAGTAGCNQRSTIVVGRRRDRCRRSCRALANDCLHMVVNNDPGLKAFLASNASPQAKAERYLVLMTRSRFDVYPPVNATPTGTHSAVFVPNRPAQVRGNTKGRPAYVWLSDENGGCPLNYARMVSVESEIVADHGRRVRDSRQPDRGVPRRRRPPSRTASRGAASPQQNHNPTVFKNLVFTTWYGHGLRAIDISQPADAARGRLRDDRSAGHRANLSGLQGRADLLGGQRHRPARRAIHRTAQQTNCPARARACTKATRRARIAERWTSARCSARGSHVLHSLRSSR